MQYSKATLKERIVKAMKSVIIFFGLVFVLIACFSFHSYDTLNVCSSRISTQEIEHMALPDISSDMEIVLCAHPIFHGNAHTSPFMRAYDSYALSMNGFSMNPVIFAESEDDMMACLEDEYSYDELSKLELEPQDAQRILESCLGDVRNNEAPVIGVYDRNSNMLATCGLERNNHSPSAGSQAIIAFSAGSIIVNGACTAQNKRIAYAGRLVAQVIIKEKIAQANVVFAP